MNRLPYIQPERELHYNLGAFLLILYGLAQTSRKKKVLTIDKIQSFYFLVSRPVFLNKVLMLAGKRPIAIGEVDYYTVGTLAVNVDELFDRERIITMMTILSSKKYLSTEYCKSEGFLFDLTDAGESIAEKLDDGYFRKIKIFVDQLSSLQSKSPSKLNGYINEVLKQGA